MKMKAFKAYDIRGEWGTDLNEDIAYRIGYFLPEVLDTDTYHRPRQERGCHRPLHYAYGLLVDGQIRLRRLYPDHGITQP